jgi:hypothetical protein
MKEASARIKINKLLVALCFNMQLPRFPVVYRYCASGH